MRKCAVFQGSLHGAVASGEGKWPLWAEGSGNTQLESTLQSLSFSLWSLSLSSLSRLLVVPIGQTQLPGKEQVRLLLSPYSLVSQGPEPCGTGWRVDLKVQIDLQPSYFLL